MQCDSCTLIPECRHGRRETGLATAGVALVVDLVCLRGFSIRTVGDRDRIRLHTVEFESTESAGGWGWVAGCRQAWLQREHHLHVKCGSAQRASGAQLWRTEPRWSTNTLRGMPRTGSFCADGVLTNGDEDSCILLPEWAIRCGPRKTIYFDPQQVGAGRGRGCEQGSKLRARADAPQAAHGYLPFAQASIAGTLMHGTDKNRIPPFRAVGQRRRCHVRWPVPRPERRGAGGLGAVGEENARRRT